MMLGRHLPRPVAQDSTTLLSELWMKQSYGYARAHYRKLAEAAQQKLFLPLGNARPIYAGLACSPCVSAYNHRKTACNDNVCMRAITVDEVFDAITQVLSEPPNNRMSGNKSR